MRRVQQYSSALRYRIIPGSPIGCSVQMGVSRWVAKVMVADPKTESKANDAFIPSQNTLDAEVALET